MSKKSKKDKYSRARRAPLVLLLSVSLAVLILVLNILAFSYSWFTPSSVTAQGLDFDENYSVRSENCEFKTYQGEIVTEDMKLGRNGYKANDYSNYSIDQVKYSNTEITSTTPITIPRATETIENGETVTIPGRVYFRTEIQNQDTHHPSVISLYHESMPPDLSVAVTYPSNTYHYVGTVQDFEAWFGAGTTGWPDYFIIRNAYVKVKDMNDADGPGLLPVEWFVENNDTTRDLEIEITGKLYLMYN